MKASDAALLAPQDESLRELAALAPDAELAESDEDGCMAECMNARDGHLTLRWHRNSKKECEEAEKTFNDLIAAGCAIFAMAKGGRSGAQVYKFDPRVKGYVVQPNLRGG